jgi:zinc protease
MMNKSQADIAYGFVTITRRDPAYYAFSLMNNAFGQYSIGGRLGDSIRERQGMAYYVSSALDANIGEGPLVIRAGISPANVDRAVASIDEEVARLVSDGLTAKELDDSRRHVLVG